MSIHLPKRKLEIDDATVSKAENKEAGKAVVDEAMKSGDTTKVYKDKNHSIKKELSFQTPKNNKGIA